MGLANLVGYGHRGRYSLRGRLKGTLEAIALRCITSYFEGSRGIVGVLEKHRDLQFKQQVENPPTALINQVHSFTFAFTHNDSLALSIDRGKHP